MNPVAADVPQPLLPHVVEKSRDEVHPVVNFDGTTDRAMATILTVRAAAIT